MFNFLKSFLSGEKTAEEQSLFTEMQSASAENTAKKRDVILLDAYAMDGEEEEPAGGCGSGCGGCGCR
jgi:hypothetical protein